jgi:hypothetical protein
MTDREQLETIERMLHEYGCPDEVWIGTDSTADKVRWLLNRMRAFEGDTPRQRLTRALENVLEIDHEETERRKARIRELNAQLAGRSP